MLLGDLESIDRFEWSGRRKSVNSEAGVYLLDIERIPVMRYNDIRFIEDIPEVPN